MKSEANNYIRDMEEAIGRTYNCVARHVETVPVVEKRHGKIVWEGNVEVFDINGHNTAKRCYAWSHTESGEVQYSTFLHCAPIVAPLHAVRAYLTDKLSRV